MNFVDKFYYIMHHPLHRDTDNYYENQIEVTPQMVHPITKEIDDDAVKNTEVAFWVELSYLDKTPKDAEGYLGNTCMFHEWELDTGASTYEQVVSSIYELVVAKYGKY